MKKTLIFILAAVMVLSTGTATALAANERRQGNNTSRRTSEASYSQSSTCPYRESTSAGSNIDATTPTRKRQREYRKENCTGMNYRDENSDGICDNYSPEKCGGQRGTRNGRR